MCCEDEPGHFVGAFDQRPVANLVQDDLAHHAAVRPAALEDAAGLRHHRLRREDVGARPTGHGAKLAERAEVEQRLVADDLVLVTADPEQRPRLDRDRRRRSCCTTRVKTRC